MYAEGSDVNGQTKDSGDVARLNSPTFISVDEDICVSFFYHMYGQSMGSLNIRVSFICLSVAGGKVILD